MSNSEVGRKLHVIANVGDDRHSPGFVFVSLFNPAEKLNHSLKKLGLFWLVALFSVLVPVFHFVLVPLFLFLGIVFAWRSFKSEGRVLHGETHCPHCQTAVKVEPAEIHWPISEICQNCARVVRIEKQDE